MKSNRNQKESGVVRVFCKYITKNGVRIYPKNAPVFSFVVDNRKA